LIEPMRIETSTKVGETNTGRRSRRKGNPEKDWSGEREGGSQEKPHWLGDSNKTKIMRT